MIDGTQTLKDAALEEDAINLTRVRAYRYNMVFSVEAGGPAYIPDGSGTSTATLPNGRVITVYESDGMLWIYRYDETYGGEPVSLIRVDRNNPEDADYPYRKHPRLVLIDTRLFLCFVQGDGGWGLIHTDWAFCYTDDGERWSKPQLLATERSDEWHFRLESVAAGNLDEYVWAISSAYRMRALRTPLMNYFGTDSISDKADIVTSWSINRRDEGMSTFNIVATDENGEFGDTIPTDSGNQATTMIIIDGGYRSSAGDEYVTLLTGEADVVRETAWPRKMQISGRGRLKWLDDARADQYLEWESQRRLYDKCTNLAHIAVMKGTWNANVDHLEMQRLDNDEEAIALCTMGEMSQGWFSIHFKNTTSVYTLGDSAAAKQGIVFNYQDEDNYWFFCHSGITKKVSGVWSTVRYMQSYAVAGYWCGLAIKFTRDTFTCYYTSVGYPGYPWSPTSWWLTGWMYGAATVVDQAVNGNIGVGAQKTFAWGDLSEPIEFKNITFADHNMDITTEEAVKKLSAYGGLMDWDFQEVDWAGNPGGPDETHDPLLNIIFGGFPENYELRTNITSDSGYVLFRATDADNCYKYKWSATAGGFVKVVAGVETVLTYFPDGYYDHIKSSGTVGGTPPLELVISVRGGYMSAWVTGKFQMTAYDETYEGPGKLVGYSGCDKPTVPMLFDLHEYLYVDVGESAFSALKRVLSGRCLSIYTRNDGTLRVWKPRDRDPSGSPPYSDFDFKANIMTAYEHTYDPRQCISHIRVVGAWEEAELFEAQGLRWYSTRFVKVDGPNLMDAPACREAGHYITNKARENLHTWRITCRPQLLAEPTDMASVYHDIHTEISIVSGFALGFSGGKLVGTYELRRYHYI